MALLGQIEALIEEEVQRRVDASLTPMLEYISRTYDVRLDQLMRDLGTFNNKPICTGCQGVAKKGKRCKNRAKPNGFCHMHQDQVPKPKSRTVEQHTHTDPVFVAGCPVCERSAQIKELTDCFENE